VALLGKLGIARDATILDLGAGTARSPSPRRPRSGTSSLVDISPVMVDVLRAGSGDAGADNVPSSRAGC